MRALFPLSKYILILAFFAFFFVGFFGFSHMDMTMGSDGEMSSGNCFMPGMTASLCQMDPLEHIASWQNMFTVLPSQGDPVLLLLALLALALGALFIRSYNSTPPQALVLQPAFAYYKRYVPIVSPLQEAFSSGILHPKIF